MEKIGIVTFHSSHNYGSVFQAFALSSYFQDIGFEANIIDFRHPAARYMYEFVWWNPERSFRGNIYNIINRGLLHRGNRKEKAFNKFIEEKLPLTRRYQTRFDIDEHFDYLVCGSDQIWNPRAADSRDMIYFLDFGDNNIKRFSYAASSGSRKFLDKDIPKIKPLLLRMSNIGVREQFMQNYLKEELGMDSTINPDPTLLLKKDKWERLEEPIEGLPEHFAVLYTLQERDVTILRSCEIARKLGLPLVLINNIVKPLYGKKMPVDYNLYDVSPGQFLWLFHNADFCISNSFHGNMFSIIYRKQFVCLQNEFNDTRISTLHNKIGLGESRILLKDEGFDKINTFIDYSTLESKIDAFREEGIEYILSNIAK